MERTVNKFPIDCLLIDLDDTLYSSALGIGQACKKNIEEFLAMRCGLSEEEAYSMRVELFRSYGSSLAGLIALGYDVHPDEYHSYVHGRLPYEQIKADPELRDLLLSIRQTKILFTNSDRQHAKRALERLGVEEECFHTIICFETMNPHLFDGRRTDRGAEVILKPAAAAVETAVRLAGFDPRRTLFLDDSERNIAAGKAVGLRTALVGKRAKTKEADYLVDDLCGLRQVAPEIWGEEKAVDCGMTSPLRCSSDMESMRPTAVIQA